MYLIISKKFEYTKGVIKIRKSKDKQHMYNGQKKKDNSQVNVLSHKASLTQTLFIELRCSKPGKWAVRYMCARKVNSQVYVC